MFFTDTIRKRAIAAIEDRITRAEVKYKTGCEEIEKKAEEDKETLATKLVEEVIGGKK